MVTCQLIFMLPETRVVSPAILRHVSRNPELYRPKKQLLIRPDLQPVNGR